MLLARNPANLLQELKSLAQKATKPQAPTAPQAAPVAAIASAPWRRRRHKDPTAQDENTLDFAITLVTRTSCRSSCDHQTESEQPVE